MKITFNKFLFIFFFSLLFLGCGQKKTSEVSLYKLNESENVYLENKDFDSLKNSLQKSNKVQTTIINEFIPEPIRPTPPVQPRAIVCYRLNQGSPWDCFVVNKLNDCNQLQKCVEDMNCKCMTI